MSNKNSVFSSQPYKGTRDFYPRESIISWSDRIYDKSKQKYYFAVLEKVLRQNGFSEYSSSLIEEAEIFVAKSGEDLGGSQLYRFEDKGERLIALRPELTVSVARMVANQFQNLRFPLRWFTSDNCFRYERPQKGRLREFWQTEVNIIGAKAGGVDLEIMALAVELFQGLGAEPKMFKILYNHRGVLEKWIEKNNWQNQKTEIFRILDNWFKLDENQRLLELSKTLSKVESDKVVATANKQGLAWQEYQNIAFEFPELKLIIENLNQIYPEFNLEFSPAIIRGQAYYTGLIFEAFDTNPTNNRSLFGGGRFDDLLGLYNQNTPAIGFAPGDVSMHEFLEGWNLYPDLSGQIHKVGIVVEHESLISKVFSQVIPTLKVQNKFWDIDYTYDRAQNKRIESLKKRGCQEIVVVSNN